MEIGGDFIDCIYEFLDMFFDVFILYGLYMLREDIMFLCFFIVSCFTCDTLVIDLYYKVIHGICFLFFVL